MNEIDPNGAWETVMTTAMAGLKAWRRAHPRATLAEIEAARSEQLASLMARIDADLAVASAAADLRRIPLADRPSCPTCGGALEVVGQEARRLTTAQERTMVVERSRGRCSACGAEFFPPG